MKFFILISTLLLSQITMAAAYICHHGFMKAVIIREEVKSVEMIAPFTENRPAIILSVVRQDHGAKTRYILNGSDDITLEVSSNGSKTKGALVERASGLVKINFHSCERHTD